VIRSSLSTLSFLTLSKRLDTTCVSTTRPSLGTKYQQPGDEENSPKRSMTSQQHTEERRVVEGTSNKDKDGSRMKALAVAVKEAETTYLLQTSFQCQPAAIDSNSFVP